MDAARFDRLTKWLATRRLSRQVAVRAAALTGTSRARAAAAQATPPSPAPAGGMAENNATYFVQTATGGSFRPNPQAGTPVASSPGGATHGTYLLTLTGHNGETIAFSDRPARTFGEVVLVEPLAPHYDASSQPLTYEANLLHHYPNARGDALAPLAARAESVPPASFTKVSLFIDDCRDAAELCWAPANPLCTQVGLINSAGRCWS